MQERDVTQVARVGTHSHVRGLGVDGATLAVSAAGDGLVGQEAARRAAAVVVRLVAEGRIGGRGVLLAGPPGSGKTALAQGVAQALGSGVPFVAIAAPEVYALGVSKTEALTQALRRAVAVAVREETDVICGEVVEFAVERGASGARGRLTLKTTDMEAAYELGERMVESLSNARVSSGDVVSIERATGRVSRLGRSFARARDFDAGAGSFAAVPEGELQTRRETEHVVSLHEADVVGGSATGGFLSLFSGATSEISAETRLSVDARVSDWLACGKARLVSGVLFVDEAHMLDAECFSFLNRAMEAPRAPLLVLATNRGTAPVRGDETRRPVPFGIPADMLDRLLVIQTAAPDASAIAAILRLRAAEEDISVSDAAIDSLVSHAERASLRHAMQLLTAAHFAAARRNAPTVDVADVDRVSRLFSHA